jgi:Na+/H+ antiporter NhaD/arsenite permease-like protein
MISLAIFTGTYLVLAIGHFPGFRIDRTGAAIIGASLMIGTGVLTFDEAVRAVDYSTLVLLFGMMIVVANLRFAGFFRWVSVLTVRHTRGPLTLLGAVVALSGVFSAFFVNDTVCLALTPLVLEITRAVQRNPVPYLLAVAMASNVGSVATVTGNPQNMMIGSLSRIPYPQFAAALAPVAAAGLVLTFVVIAILYRKEFVGAQPLEVQALRVRLNKALLWKSVAASAAMILLFFAGWPVAKVAVVAGAWLLVTRRVKPEKVYHEIDWALLSLFAGLFVVVAGVEKTSLEEDLLRFASHFRLGNVWVLSGFSALLSNLVSNVPAVLVFRPLVDHLPVPRQGWLALAMSSTLAGNLTILGSVANLIVVQRARHEVKITFWEYLRVGVPLTLLTLAAGAAWLQWRT